ncbi:MAG: hypothetical protein HOL62_01285 [Candidatus Marinimicrobia bacterium]|jgi:hypothetical protein|nr:hypothetical protein [Candidatus Neomarinimicrobiota bacterium]
MNRWRKEERNNRPVRSSQLITTWGIGSIQSFPNDDSFMLLGLDAWEYLFSNPQEFDMDRLKEHTIIENRLARRLRVRSFRKPIIFNSKEPTPMPYVRFPNWHYCPRCGHLERLRPNQHRNLKNPHPSTVCPKIYDECKNNKHDIQLIPSRFVLICENGHIDDFDYKYWLKREAKGELKKDVKLRLKRGRNTSSIFQMSVECTANKVETKLDNLFKFYNTSDKGEKCNGAMPWLGIYGWDKDNCEDCDSSYTITYRNSLNVHSKIIQSSISIPSQDEMLPDSVIEDINERLSYFIEDPSSISTEAQIQSDKTNISKLQIESYINSLVDSINDEEVDEVAFRNDEYQILKSGGGNKNDKLFFAESNFSPFKNKILNKLIKSVSTVHRLTETSAFVGFNRLVSGEIPLLSKEEDLEKLKSKLSRSSHINWLPAYQSKGEGIFIDFNSDSINKWINSKNTLLRTKKIEENYNKNRIDRGKETINLNPAYPLIHSFSHLLIEKLSYHCGYGAASLKEKIYTNICLDDDIKMSGILIYTIGGGDGSLGGLSNLSKSEDLEKIIIQSLLDSVWCSSDPICIESEGQGNGLCNLAACHNCLLIPETSCESFNVLLDRKLLIDVNDNCGYFGNLVNEELEKL